MPKRGKNGWKDKNGDHLVVEQDLWSGDCTISWLCVDDGEIGGALGEFEDDGQSKELCKLCREAGGKQKQSRTAFLWDDEADAKKALRRIEAGMLAWEDGKSWPEWALKAKAEGWTPPKGWTP